MKRLILLTTVFFGLFIGNNAHSHVNEIIGNEKAEIYNSSNVRGLWIESEDFTGSAALYLDKRIKTPVLQLDDGTNTKNPFPRFSIFIHEKKVYIQVVDEESGVLQVELNKILKEMK